MTRPAVDREDRGPIRLSTVFGLVLATACLYWARQVAIPFVLAVLLAFLLAPAVSALEHKRVPSILAVVLVVALTLTTLAGIGQVIGYEISVLAEELPYYRGNILSKIVDVRGIQKASAFGRLQMLARDMMQQVERREAVTADERPVPVVVEPPPIGSRLLSVLPMLGSAGLVLVLLIFMLLRRKDLRNRLIRLFGYHRLALTTKALDEAGERVTRYVVRQALVNTSFGVAVGVGLYLIGLPYAALWGSLAALLRFVPYLGVGVAMTLPALVSLAVFPGWMEPLYVVGLIGSLEVLIYVCVEPWFYGRGTGVSEVALLLSLAFWGWLWGPIGVLLATPMTVCFVVLGKHMPALRPIAMLLSDAPVVAPSLVFYQRLIAKDEREADRVARRYLEEHSREVTFDLLLAPAIAHTDQDHAAGILTDNDRQFALATIETIARGIAGIGESAASDRRREGHPAILAFPVQDDADELAVTLLALMLEADGLRMAVMSNRLLASEVLATVEREAPALVCFGSLSTGGFAPTRYLVKRLRARFADLPIVVGQWGMVRQAPPEWRDRLLGAGANHVGGTLGDVRDYLIQVARDAERGARKLA